MGSAERQGELWGAAAADWAETNERYVAPYWRAMLEDLNVGAGMVFFDAGCGAGGGCKLALDRGARVYGLDASAGMIDYARDHYPAADFRVGELENLPFEDAFFDAVMAANSVQYCENPHAALRELHRVCKKSGMISVCTWDVREKNDQRFLQEAVAKFLPEPPKPGGGPYALAETGKLEAFVESAGFQVVGGRSVPTVYLYEDSDELIRAQFSTGNAQAILETVEEGDYKQALTEFFEDNKSEDGRLGMNNVFRFVSAVPI